MTKTVHITWLKFPLCVTYAIDFVCLWIPIMGPDILLCCGQVPILPDEKFSEGPLGRVNHRTDHLSPH